MEKETFGESSEPCMQGKQMLNNEVDDDEDEK